MKNKLTKLGLAVLFSTSLLFSSIEEDKTLIKNKVSILTNKIAETLSSDEKKEIKKIKILSYVAGVFDYRLMAKLVLGKKYWNKFNKSQQLEFTSLFKEKLENTFFIKSEIYKGEKISIEDKVTLKKNKAYIKASFKLDNENKTIKYKFYKTKQQKWLIYDIEIFKISIIKSYRHQFKDLLSKNKVSTFLDIIKNG